MRTILTRCAEAVSNKQKNLLRHLKKGLDHHDKLPIQFLRKLLLDNVKITAKELDLIEFSYKKSDNKHINYKKFVEDIMQLKDPDDIILGP